ncbi:copia protein [Tanacetum coccineum]|uniref:Copia protein n=1 Tax=Tanacetum coccineum TaxID=301880 RepID=A0ABQ5DJZ0_9ASTR
MKTEESLNVTFDETPPPSKTSPLVDDDLDEEESIKVTEKKSLENDIEGETLDLTKLVAQGYNQQEGIGYDETYALVASEEVYVAQNMGFIDFEKPDHVYKLKKALYGLKQAPNADTRVFVVGGDVVNILVLEETKRCLGYDQCAMRSRIRKLPEKGMAIQHYG